MKKSLKVTVLATAIAAALPFQANAAGLGGINVYSALGQPLRAEIELNASADELGTMSAAVPSPEAFRRANLEYSPLLSDLEMRIERRGSNSVIRLSTSRVINEPFMDVLVELRWAAGSLLREYTFLLDPVENMPAAAVAAPAASRTVRSDASAAAAGGASSGQHTVRRGETLHRIALANLPPGAELEQMLIALLRENPDAFAGGNINRLRAGESLSIPDEIAVAAIPAEQARREVLAQQDEFEAYRNRVASAVAARAPVAEQEAGRESAGRIEPRVQDVVREAAPVDQVEVSGAPESSRPVGSDVGVESREGSAVPEEDLVVLRRELEEMRARLSDLEQTVSDQQDIISIRDSVIARLQGEGEGEGAGDVVSGQAAAPAPEETPADAAAPVTQTAAEPPVAVTPEPPRPAPAPVAPPPASPGMLESLTSNPLMLAGGAAVIGLLALLGLRVARRRREEQGADTFAHGMEPDSESLSVVSQPGGESVDTDSGSTGMDTDFSQTGLSAIDADEGVDPVAEADVYLAYGRDAQAEEILLDALKVDASRHAIYLKLLEVYVQRGDRRQFEVIATDLYSRTGGDGADWQKAAAMGRKLDPENPLYGEREAGDASAGVTTAGLAAAGAAAAASGEVRALEDTQIGLDQTELSIPGYDEEPEAETPVADQAPDEAGPGDLDFDLGDFGQAAASPAEPEQSAPAVEDDGNALSFDLDMDVPEAAAEPEPQPEAEPEVQADPAATLVPEIESGAEETLIEEETVMDLERTEFDANLLDFDLDLSPPSPEKPAAPQGMDLTSIDLDLDLPPQEEAPAEAPPAAAPEAPADESEPAAVPKFDAQDMQREMETKLELARAYDEMGDREGARELLDEVLKDGTAEQREEAERMLERLA